MSQPDGFSLRDLNAVFIRHEWADPEHERDRQVPVKAISEAQGVRFLCPKCYAENGGPVGTHGVVCWSRSRGAPDDASPGPGRWALVGTGLDDLTLAADPPSKAPSVKLLSGCEWHGFVRKGRATLR